MLHGGIGLNPTVLSCSIQGVPFPARFPSLSPYPSDRAYLTEINVKIQISVSGQQLLPYMLSDQISDEVGTTYEWRPCTCS